MCVSESCTHNEEWRDPKAPELHPHHGVVVVPRSSCPKRLEQRTDAEGVHPPRQEVADSSNESNQTGCDQAAGGSDDDGDQRIREIRVCSCPANAGAYLRAVARRCEAAG